LCPKCRYTYFEQDLYREVLVYLIYFCLLFVKGDNMTSEFVGKNLTLYCRGKLWQYRAGQDRAGYRLPKKIQGRTGQIKAKILQGRAGSGCQNF
jgi:hypothetical protein